MHNRLKAKLWTVVEALVVVVITIALGWAGCYWAWRLIDQLF